MVVALAEALGADNFASLFEVGQTLTPTKVFTETSCQLPSETRAALNLAGVRQIVAILGLHHPIVGGQGQDARRPGSRRRREPGK